MNAPNISNALHHSVAPDHSYEIAILDSPNLMLIADTSSITISQNISSKFAIGGASEMKQKSVQ